ncbi:glycosyltransferase family 4 protein [Flavobacteriales bacterium]|nr:glycosyltransferase family 4 protein [Flavobacteriales bacterium]
MKSKIIILNRVIQAWRAPIYEKLFKEKDIDLEVWYGPDFLGTKVVSTKRNLAIIKQKIWSFKIKLKSVNGVIAMPFSPFLFIKLILKNPEAIISEGASNLANSIVAFVYCKIFHKKYIWWSLGKIDGRTYDKKRKFIDNIITYIERKSDRILTYSSVGKMYFKNLGIDDNKIVIAVNVIDTETKLNAIQQYEDAKELNHRYKEYDFITLFVGALTKEKSIERLLRAQKIIESKKLNACLILVGDGSYRNELLEEAKKLNLKSVDFVGEQITESYKYFSIANLFVLPGLGGLAISEAMCFGLPLVVSIGDGCEVDLVTKDNGIIDKYMRPKNLAEHIQFFYDNKNIALKFGEKSKNIVINQYNSKNYIKMIKSVVKN